MCNTLVKNIYSIHNRHSNNINSTNIKEPKIITHFCYYIFVNVISYINNFLHYS